MVNIFISSHQRKKKFTQKIQFHQIMEFFKMLNNKQNHSNLIYILNKIILTNKKLYKIKILSFTKSILKL